MDEVLSVIGISRTFGHQVALADVSFDVGPGRMTGFIGANGAGKTTAMRIIMGVLAADTGRVELGGRELTLPVRSRFGYMPEERGLYPKMKIAEQLIYLGRVHGLSAATARRRTDELLERFGLTDRADDLLQTLSLGNQQRVQVAAALVHDPLLLVLDEPFSGLDPLAMDAMGDHLRERAAAGVPVLFSSHQLELVERLCDDVVIIHDGQVVAAGEAQALRTARAGRRIRLRVEPEGGGRPDPGAIIGGLEGVTLRGREEQVLLLDLTDDADDQAVLSAARRQGAVREFAPAVPTLAEIFREVVR